jgi:pyrroline-5-carboxylate reductase
MLQSKKIAFLGAGSMAEAMISGIIKKGEITPSTITVTNKSNLTRLNHLQMKYDITVMDKEHIPYEEMDIFVLAMKPKDAETALLYIRDKVAPHQLILSVIAGISLEYMESFFKEGQQLIRVMPNTSAMISESVTAFCTDFYTSEKSILTADALLKCIGDVYQIPEEHMDIFTGIAGSGPAYFYYLMEHIEEVALENGLNREIAREIAAKMIQGAAKMMIQQEDTPAQLRKKVTSPNGTTAAGLEALEKHGGGKAIFEAIQNAARRSKEISSELQNKDLIL